MKKVLFIIVMITLPVLTFGQNAADDFVNQNDVITLETLNITQETENEIAFGTFTKNDVTNLSYKKSIELISIKAYRKSLQIRVKEIKTC